jgi:3-deoxy-D-manno-octulosonic-acid transferase
LRRIDPICVQSELDQARMLTIGAPKENVHCMGTAKFDVAERDPAGEQRARGVMEKVRIPEDAVVLLGGSTWPGEEAVLCDMYCRLKKKYPRLFLVLVPRHVERAEEVVACLEERGLSYVRRSRIEDFSGAERPHVLFVDTTGELRNFYSVADIIFVGKSLLHHGGQNPIEPALCGKAVVVGPNMENFPAVIPPFMEKKAIVQVSDAASLEEQIDLLLADATLREQLGQRAAGVVAENAGVVEQTVRLLNRE